MHLRVVHLTADGTIIEEAIAGFEEETAPLRRLPGFAALALLSDTDAGMAMVGSYWETEDAMRSSEARARQCASELSLKVVDLEGYEVLHLERAHPLRAGTFARIVTAQGSPDRIGDAERDLHERLLPRARAQHGFRSVAFAANRQKGRLFCGSVWETAAARAASDAVFAPDRRRLDETIGASSVLVENYEVAYADVRVGAGTAT